MKIIEGNLVVRDMKIGIVAGRFNEFIVSKLISGAMDGLVRHNVAEDDVTLADKVVLLKGSVLSFLIN